MSITEHLNKIKSWLLPLNLVLIGILGFGIGRWSKIEETKTPILIENPAGEQGVNATPIVSGTSETTSTKTGALVGSKNGTKYHYPWCNGATRIKEENKIWFASAEEAKKAGYNPAANCPGL